MQRTDTRRRFEQEDPYQLRLFGKSPQRIETIAADFLPDGEQLYIVVADADCNLHILQFDPDSMSLSTPTNKHILLRPSPQQQQQQQ